MESLHQRLDSHAIMRDLVKLDVKDTLQYDQFENALNNARTFSILDEEPEVTPEWGNSM